MPSNDKKQLLPGATPFVVGVLLYGTALVTLFPEGARVYILGLSFIAATAVTAATSIMQSRPVRRSIAAWRAALPPTSLVVGAFLFNLLIGSAIGRFTALTFVMLLLVSYYLKADGLGAFDDEKIDNLLGFSRLLSAVGIFFLTVFAFGIDRFVYLPQAVLALGLGVLYSIAAYESYLQAEIVPERIRRMAAVASGAIGLELYVGLSFLPTPFITTAAVCTVAFYTFMLAMNRVLIGSVGTRELRLALGLAIGLLAAMLGTARWT
jgi:hypothetical protein